MKQDLDVWGEYECFNVKTGFRTSKIEGAGSGRFITEKARQGDVLRKSKVYFDSFVSDKNCVIALKDLASIETHLQFKDIVNKPSNSEQINNFACTPFNTAPDLDPAYVYWWQPVCYFNHADGDDSNVFIEITMENTDYFFEMKALRDIEKGEELFIDYRNFKLPAWFKKHNSEKGFSSTEDFGILKSGPHIDDTFTIHKYTEQHEQYKAFIDNFYQEHQKKDNDFSIHSFMNRLPNQGKVLDMGCCTGWHANQFYEAGFDVTAVDASEKYINALDRKINPTVGTFETLAYDNVFDGFILSWVLHHLHREGITKALQKTHRSLKKKGWLYISTVEETNDYRDSIGRLYTTFTENELVKLLTENNFSVKHIEKHQLNHFEATPMTGICLHAQRN